jgi:hypothetical protein
MRVFRSNEEFFEAVRELLSRLELRAHHDAAVELRNGFASISGLTDGWAQFLQSVERVQTTASRRFAPEDRRALEAIQAAAHTAVFRQ